MAFGGALEQPCGERPCGDAWVVFAQADDASLDLARCRAHAERFFACRIGLAEEPPDEGPGLAQRALRFVVAPAHGRAGIVSVLSMRRSDADLAAALDADARAGAAGLGLLARRCNMVWRVERTPETEWLALLLATVLASVLLGPILDPRSSHLFGVKTARERLAAISQTSTS